MKRKEAHLGTKGEMDTPKLLDPGTDRLKPSDNILNERGSTGEHRDYDTIPKAVQAPSDIFHQEAQGDAMRMLTPETSGVSVKTEAPAYQEGQGKPSSQPQFKRKLD